MRLRFWLAGLATMWVCSLFAGTVSAYCRTTTCNPSKYDCGVDANGCNATGAPVSWRALPLTYRFNAAGSSKLDMDRAFDVIRAAFDTWSNVDCNGKRTSLRFVEGKTFDADKPMTQGARGKVAFGIYFRDESWPYDKGQDSLALTNVQFGEINGYIDYADIEINTKESTFALGAGEAGFDFQSVMTHEVGHYIGLAHSSVADSIMVKTYCENPQRCAASKEQQRALAEDDITAVCALYPPSGIAGVRYEEPDKGCSVGAAPSSTTGTIAVGAGFAVLSVAAARRRRRR